MGRYQTEQIGCMFVSLIGSLLRVNKSLLGVYRFLLGVYRFLLGVYRFLLLPVGNLAWSTNWQVSRRTNQLYVCLVDRFSFACI